MFLQPPDLVRWGDRSGAISHQIWELAPNPSPNEFVKTLLLKSPVTQGQLTAIGVKRCQKNLEALAHYFRLILHNL
jgi:hypothetical protein